MVLEADINCLLPLNKKMEYKYKYISECTLDFL